MARLVCIQVAKQSNAARSMCLWVHALDVYGRMVKVVEPKRQALRQAEAALAQIEAQLGAKREQLRECTIVGLCGLHPNAAQEMRLLLILQTSSQNSFGSHSLQSTTHHGILCLLAMGSVTRQNLNLDDYSCL